MTDVDGRQEMNVQALHRATLCRKHKFDAHCSRLPTLTIMRVTTTLDTASEAEGVSKRQLGDLGQE